MEVGQIGETGAHVIVITALEQELGTEPDLVLTHHHLAMERKYIAICYNKPSIHDRKQLQ